MRRLDGGNVHPAKVFFRQALIFCNSSAQDFALAAKSVK